MDRCIVENNYITTNDELVGNTVSNKQSKVKLGVGVFSNVCIKGDDVWRIRKKRHAICFLQICRCLHGNDFTFRTDTLRFKFRETKCTSSRNLIFSRPVLLTRSGIASTWWKYRMMLIFVYFCFCRCSTRWYVHPHDKNARQIVERHSDLPTNMRIAKQNSWSVDCGHILAIKKRMILSKLDILKCLWPPCPNEWNSSSHTFLAQYYTFPTDTPNSAATRRYGCFCATRPICTLFE